MSQFLLESRVHLMEVRRHTSVLVCLLVLSMGCADSESAAGPAVSTTEPSAPTQSTQSEPPYIIPQPDKPQSPTDTPPAEKEAPDFLGQPCVEHENCIDEETGTTGYCVATHPAGGKTCTVECVDECPSGYGCTAVANAAGSDSLFLCINKCDGTVTAGCPAHQWVFQVGSAVIKSQDAEHATRITVGPGGPVGRSLPEGAGHGVSWGFYNVIR